MFFIFEFKKTSLEGVYIITPFHSSDSRGSFMKIFESGIFQNHGICMQPYEAFFTTSKKGTIRGLHFQREQCQSKLVHVLLGCVYDVVVDLRPSSPTFGQWEGFYLSDQNKHTVYIPQGFAHGFLALEDNTLFSYLCGEPYDPITDGGIYWNSPELNINWPVHCVDQIIVSEKDQMLPPFSEFIKNYGGLSLRG